MGKLYPRLAWQNIRRGRQLYLPYLLTLMVTAAAFYVAVALSQPTVWPEGVRYIYLSMFMGHRHLCHCRVCRHLSHLHWPFSG